MRKKGLEYHFWWVVGGIHSPSSSECSTVCPPTVENDDEGSARAALAIAVHLLSNQLRCRHLSYLMMGTFRAAFKFYYRAYMANQNGHLEMQLYLNHL